MDNLKSLLKEAVNYQAEQFDGASDTDLNVSGADTVDWLSEFRQRAKAALASESRDDWDARAAEIGKSAYECIAEMVAALECDYDRLEELRADRKSIAHDEDAPARLPLWDDENGEELKELESAAGDCESRDDAEQRIHEDPLSIEVRGDWYAPGDEDKGGAPSEFTILLGTGGPAVRIIGELNQYGEPTHARLQVQDWFKPWTEYLDADLDTLLTYCRCFYFGEG